MADIIKNILLYGSIGCVLFTILLIIAGATGLASAVRDEEGKFRKKLTWKSALGFSLFMLFFCGIMYFGNVSLVDKNPEYNQFSILWLNAFGVFFVMHLYDLIVLDYLIIVKWHPKFLNLPNTDYYNTFRPHFEGFLRGIPLGAVVSLIVALLN